MAIPLLQAVSAGLSAFNAVNTVSSLLGGEKSAAVSSNGAAAATAVSGSRAAEQEDRFLKLLVAQMRNQDPLNPLDNAQVTTQMAQISTVTGVEKLNGSVHKLSQTLVAAQSLQSTDVIGRNVLAPGATLALGATGATAALDLASAADRVQVTITTPAGAVVRRIEFGAQAAGIAGFHWDGLTDAGNRAPAGKYAFQVAATSGGRPVTATALAAGRIDGVSISGGAVQLSVEDGADLPVSEVRRIY
ncbi:MAG: flagellar hook assembly protein FlgD [Burkholderiales bacterium]